ncbi:otoferlin [Plakobranchus ocellatus]|uniref:Otoferlin n=1 Tax=Plakobranchus ocellatus TaxID=259542 RepID=A0AAV3ZRM9_9GAST|nr:otoferlin [Plakobranchus ocellatus]
MRLSHYTKTVENVEDSVVFDEMFEWPVARPIEAEEMIDIQIFNFNKYLSNRLVGTFRMILQQLIEVGNVKISDCLLDTNNVVMRVISGVYALRQARGCGVARTRARKVSGEFRAGDAIYCAINDLEMSALIARIQKQC